MSQTSPTSAARRFTGINPILIDTRADGAVFINGAKPIPSEMLTPAGQDPRKAWHEQRKLEWILEEERIRLAGEAEARRRHDRVTLGGFPTSGAPESTQTPSATIGGNPVLTPTGSGAAAPNPAASVTLNAGPVELAVIGALIFLAIKGL